MTINDIASATVAYNDEKLIGGMLDGIKKMHNLVTISKPWRGEHTSFDRTGEIAERMGAEVIYQDFKCQQDQRNFMMEYLEEKGFKYVLIIDTDEYYLESDIDKIINFINDHPAEAYSTANNDKVFWKSWKYHFVHGGATNCLRSDNRFTEKRAVKGKRSRIDVSMYHFSFNRSNEEMITKIQTREYCVMNMDWLKRYWLDWKFGEDYKDFKIKMSTDIPSEIIGRYIKSINLLY